MRSGSPQEILTDNGSQYITWRGKSAFTRELEKRGVKQIVASPRRPQTLGKIERFWGTLWRECIETAVFVDMEDARRRVGHFIDYYNFQRPHQGIEGLVPADRFFGAASEVLRTLRERVALNRCCRTSNDATRTRGGARALCGSDEPAHPAILVREDALESHLPRRPHLPRQPAVWYTARSIAASGLDR